MLTAYQKEKSSYFIPKDFSSDELFIYYLLGDEDFRLINQQKLPENRLGMGLQIAYLRYPGYPFQNISEIPNSLVLFVAQQLGISPKCLDKYGKRSATRLAHLSKIKKFYHYKSFKHSDQSKLEKWLYGYAEGTDQADLLMEELLTKMRTEKIILPALSTLEQVVHKVRFLVIHNTENLLTMQLTINDKDKLDSLFRKRGEESLTYFTWLQQSNGKVSQKYLQSLLQKITYLNTLNISLDHCQNLHPNRFDQMVKSARSFTVQQYQQFRNENKKWAYMLVYLSWVRSYLIDQIIDTAYHVVNRMKASDEKKVSTEIIQQKTTIMDAAYWHGMIGTILLESRENQQNPIEAIEKSFSWSEYEKSVTQTNEWLKGKQSLEGMSLLPRHYSSLRKFFPKLLENIIISGDSSVKDLIEATQYLKTINQEGRKKLTASAPLAFIKPSWKKWILTSNEINRAYYEFHLFLELCHALKSGDLWIVGSQKYKDLESYLYPKDEWENVDNKYLKVPLNSEQFIEEMRLITKNKLIDLEKNLQNDLVPDVRIQDNRLIISPLKNTVPTKIDKFVQWLYKRVPQTKLTQLIQKIDEDTNFSQHFKHIHTHATVKDKILLYTAILSDGINLGLTRMADACPEVDYNQLSWFYQHYMTEENYLNALGSLSNYQAEHPYASYWGSGTKSSSDGQFYPTSGTTTTLSRISAKYGLNKGVSIYTHINDQYSPIYTQLISSSEEAAHIIDGILYNTSEKVIEEHFTDSAGYAYQVFGLCQLLGIRFSPRIKKLEKRTLYSLQDLSKQSPLNSMYGGKINTSVIKECWDDLLRLGYSVRTRTVPASQILKKLASYPRQNKLALALRELGKIPCSIHLLSWIDSPEYRQNIQKELNKGEAKHSLAKALRVHQGGEIYGQSHENQLNRANGLNLLMSMIVLWNTGHIEEIIHQQQMGKEPIPEEYLKHISPLGWQHIVITGDYIWKNPD